MSLKDTVGSELVLALESAYNELRSQFPKVQIKGKTGFIPPAVIVVSSNSSIYGHYARSRWNVEGLSMSEIMVGAEGLRRDPRDVLGTLFHEAAHGIAHTADLKETSNKGTYHNKVFKAIAEEIGLLVSDAIKVHGHTGTQLPEGEQTELLKVLAPKLIAYREIDSVQRAASQFGRTVNAICGCPRTFQMYRGTFDRGDIVCSMCLQAFQEK